MAPAAAGCYARDMNLVGSVVVALLASLVGAPVGAARADGTLDAALCRRQDTRWDKPIPYLSVVRAPTAASVTGEAGAPTVTVCRGPGSTRCAPVSLGDHGAVDVNADGSLLVVAAARAARIHDVRTGKLKRTLVSKRIRSYSCGGGRWLGDVVLARGDNCEEFDALPYLANGRTGRYIAAFVSKTFEANGETLYDVAHVEGSRWAIAVFDHYQAEADVVDPTGLGVGTVFLIDVKTGKVKATAHGVAGGGVVIDEGKASRPVASVPACPAP